MDGGSIPPSSTNAYALTRGYAKNSAGEFPPAKLDVFPGQEPMEHCRAAALLPVVYRTHSDDTGV